MQHRLPVTRKTLIILLQLRSAHVLAPTGGSSKFERWGPAGSLGYSDVRWSLQDLLDVVSPPRCLTTTYLSPQHKPSTRPLP